MVLFLLTKVIVDPHEQLYCFISVSPCSPNPCHHGGHCDVGDQGSYICECSGGYSGPTCECKLFPLISRHISYQKRCIAYNMWITCESEP